MKIPGKALLCWLAIVALLPAVVEAEAYRYHDVERVVAVGDIHGGYQDFLTVLRGTGLVDAELRWTGGETHLVSLGDLLDRGDYGRQVMDLLMRLEGEAAEAGGAVHIVLGNHEVMNLTGDLRYVSHGDFAQFGAESRGELPAGFVARRAAFAPDGKYGQWLLTLPVAIMIDDTLFVHGGLSPELDGLTLIELNASSRRDIRDFAAGWHALLAADKVGDRADFRDIIDTAARIARAEDSRLREPARKLVEASAGLPFIPDGPLWYRGNALCHPYVEAVPLRALLAQFGARRVVIGHTPTRDRRIVSRLGGQVIAADTGLYVEYYRGNPSALLIEGEQLQAWYQDGVVDIPAEPNRNWDRPHGMRDDELEVFLREAEVAGSEALPGGHPGQRRVTLQDGDKQLRAVFNSTDSMPGLATGRWRRGADGAERYQHEIAAYLVDRMLGLEMVPVTVERELDGVKGSLRVWIEGSFSERERHERQIPFRGACDLAPIYEMMNVFHLLIYSVDQDLDQLRYDRHWQLWLTDHARGFGASRDIREILRRSRLVPNPELARALENVTAENVGMLAPYLNPRQVQALLQRAEQLRARR